MKHVPVQQAERVRDALRDHVSPIAVAHDATLAQVSLAWLLHREAVQGVIVGASSTTQAEANAASATIALAPDEVDRLDAGLAGLGIDPNAGLSGGARARAFALRVRRKLGRLARGG